MVPRTAIDAWSQIAPWPNETDIEQDLVLTRLLIEFAQDPLLTDELAFRGGTCLHKLHAPHPLRYSNDLDYVRTKTGPIQEIMATVRRIATYIGLEEYRYDQKRDAVIMKFGAQSTSGSSRIRVKIEINVREVEPFTTRIRRPLDADGPWFTGKADVLTFTLEELLGTKLRALYQRRKGRDLFDLWLGLEEFGANPAQIVDAFSHYLKRSETNISRADFEANLAGKLIHRGFRQDLAQLVTEIPPLYNIDTAGALIHRRLLSLLD